MTLSAMRQYLLSPSKGVLHKLPFQAFFVFIAALLLYANTLTHDYALGDRMVFTENEYALRGLDGISDILIHDSFKGFLKKHQEIRAGGQYRPFSIITFAVEYEFFGLNPTISHTINVLIYALSCLLLLFTMHKMFGNHSLPRFLRSMMPFMATMIFVFHPIHTEVVANVQQRDKLLSFFFLLLTTYIVLVGATKNWGAKFALLPLVIGSFALALISNEISVAFLAIIPLVLYCFSNLRKRELFLLGVPFWLTVMVYVKVQEFFALEAVQLNDLLNNPFLNATDAEKYATLIFVAGKYLQLLVFPRELSHDYSYNEIQIRSFDDPAVILILIFYIVGLIVSTITLIRSRNVISFAFLYFVLSLGIISTVSNLIFPTGTVMAESLLYIPSLGICIGFVYLVYYGAEHATRLQYGLRYTIYTFAWLVSALIVGLLGFKTVERNQYWKNDFILLKEDVQHVPNSVKVRNMLAEEYLYKAARERDPDRKLELINTGVAHLKHGIEIYPQNAPAWVLLGNTELALQDYYKAHACYEKAIEIDSTEADAYRSLSLIEKARGNYASSLNYTEKWIVYQNTYKITKRERSEAFTQLGELYTKIDSLDFAIVAYSTAISLNEANVDAHVGLGMAMEQKSGSMIQAIQNFRKALEYEPENTTILQHLSLALARKGDYEGGIQNIKKAIRIDRSNPDLYEHLAILYEKIGNEELARSYFRKAEALLN